MEKQKKKRIKQYISWVLAVLMVIFLACMPLLARGGGEDSGPKTTILSGKVSPEDIALELRGGGTLVSQEAAELTVPAAVKLTRLLVKNGDLVTKGQPIAEVDRVTVMTAISQVQETMDYLQEEIDDAEDDEAPNRVDAVTDGEVKQVFAKEGDDVRDVMLRHGALAVLSLDGLMAVQVGRETALAGGDRVTLRLSDGSEAEGTVESNLDGVLTVTVEDDHYTVGTQVVVFDPEGTRLGAGALYIHSPWNAVAYSGTVSGVRVREGDTVNAGRRLFALKDTGHTAQYEQLVVQYREYEEQMLELFKMYQSQELAAPCDGVVTGLDENGAYMLRSDGTWQIQLLVNAPNGDDETSYVNYVGQVTAVGIDGLTLRMNPQGVSVTDYKDLSGVPTDTALMTEQVIWNGGAPVYTLSGEEWVQIGASSLSAGDILLFAGSGGGFVWVVRIGSGALPPVEPEPTDPSEPVEPSDPTEPSEPGDPTDPTEPENPGEDPTIPTMPGGNPTITIPNMPQNGFGNYGALVPEEKFELYSQDTVTVGTVIPQETMTLTITVDELDISHVYRGQVAAVTLDTLPGESFTAEVTEIASTGTSQGGNSKFTVELTMPMESGMLPGMRAFATITLEVRENLLCVPVAALAELGAETVLYTGYDEKTETLINPVPVTVGLSDGEYAQILSGLGEGDAFWYAYYETMEQSVIPDRSYF